MRHLMVLLATLLLLPVAADARPGDLDGRFGMRGRALISLPETSTHARDLLVQPDGRLLVTGTGRQSWVVSRLRANGSPDAGFGKRGRVRLPMRFSGAEPQGVALLPDGRILVGGTRAPDGNDEAFVVVRLLANGRLDPTWGDGGRSVHEMPGRVFFGGMAVQPDGGVAVAMSVHDTDQRFVVARLAPDGRRDGGFGADRIYLDPEPGSANAILSRPDGSLLVAGTMGPFDGPVREVVVSLAATGGLDPSWGTGGRFTGPAGSFAYGILPATGGGTVVMDNLPTQPSALWLDADGRRRENWGLDGRASLRLPGGALPTGNAALDASGRLYVTGVRYYDNRRAETTGAIPGLLRLSADGVLERGFGRDGFAVVPPTRRTLHAYPSAVAVGQGDRVYLAASGSDRLQGFREDFGYTHALVARLKGWDEIVELYGVSVAPGSRRLTARVACNAATKPCRVRVDVLDRRGRRLGRARRSLKDYASVNVGLRRRARPGERLTLRLQASDPEGRSDSVTGHVRVPSRRGRS